MKNSFIGNTGKLFGLAALAIALAACQTTSSNTGSSIHWTTTELAPVERTTTELAPVERTTMPTSATPVSAGGQKFVVDKVNNLFVVQTSTGVQTHAISQINTCTDGVGIQAGPDCLVVFSKESQDYAQTPADKKTVIVFIHGDTYHKGSNYPVDNYQLKELNLLATLSGTKAFILIRPGYQATGAAGYSSGSVNDGRDNYSPRVVDTMAAAIKNILGREGAKKLLLIGHSGGSAISALMLDRHPDLAPRMAAYLSGCACDRDPYRAYRAASFNSRRQLALKKSPNPIENTTHIRHDVPIVLATGSKDTNTKPEFAKSYIALLQSQGVDAKFVLLPGMGHSFGKALYTYHMPYIRQLLQRLQDMPTKTANK